jgi:hypothetical protein
MIGLISPLYIPMFVGPLHLVCTSVAEVQFGPVLHLFLRTEN